MEHTNIVKKIKKEFKHKFSLGYDLNKIDYEISSFYTQTRVVGNGRLIVINGTYKLLWGFKYKSKDKFIVNSFQELIYTGGLKLDFNKINIDSYLLGTARLTQNNYTNDYVNLIGVICCNLCVNMILEGDVKEINERNDEEIDEKINTAKSDNQIQDSDMKALSINNNSDKMGAIKEKKKKEKLKIGHCVEEISKERKDFICISSTRWDFLWQRPHHIMERLSKKNNRVLFFNHSTAVCYEEAERLLSDSELWNERLINISTNLWVFSPVHVICKQNKDLTVNIKLYNYKLKEEALKFLIYKLQFYEPIYISYLAESIKYIKNIPRKLLCYDCIDDFSAFSWAEENTSINEEELIKESDIVIASAEELYKRIKEVNPNTFLLPNAVEYDHFAVEKTYRKPINNNRPIIGFIGAFYEWIDEELLEFLAKMRSNWGFHIIGPTQSGMGEKIKKLDNVKFFGIKEYKKLPQLLRIMNVCIIPFKLNPITDSANPIKLWEYMASGKPIVSTPIPEVKKFTDIIYIAETKEKFLLKIEEALEEDSVSLRAQRIAMAKKNDWNQRVEKLLEIINEYLIKDGNRLEGS